MRQIIKPSTTLTQYEKIELHLKSGSIYVFHTWKADSLGTIKGFGTRIAPEPSPQRPMELGSYSFPKDSVQAVYTLNENYVNTFKPFLYVLYVVGGFCVLYLLLQFIGYEVL